MSEDKQESVILCEGYYDRAFWSGWLTYLNCVDPGIKSGKKQRLPVYDPWGLPVTRGQYAYLSISSRFIRVTPCEGRSAILSEARSRLDKRRERPISRLVLNIDPDTDASSPNIATGLRMQDVLAQVKAFDSNAALNNEGDIEIDNGATKISLIRWEAQDAPTPGLPNQQTLERLVCAALIAAYPERGKCVQDWLDSRTEPCDKSVKSFVWSQMAGWYAENSCDYFYQRLWDDAKVVDELKSRLQTSGAWRIAEALAN